LSPHVGYHLSGNGDAVSGLLLPPIGAWNINGLTRVDGYKGRVISGITRELAQTDGWVIEDLWAPPASVRGKVLIRVHDPEWAEEGHFEETGEPNPLYVVTRWRNPNLYGVRQKRLIDEYHQRALAVAFIGEDGCDGRVWLDGDRVQISPPTPIHARDYEQATRAIATHLPEGTRLLTIEVNAANNLFTSVHPLGTCRMARWPGRDPSDNGGVVDGNGRVFSTTGAVENLFIADGSVVPCATIVNPSWTIAAVAEHIASYIASLEYRL
jgi:hypothetical protein